MLMTIRGLRFQKNLYRNTIIKDLLRTFCIAIGFNLKRKERFRRETSTVNIFLKIGYCSLPT